MRNYRLLIPYLLKQKFNIVLFLTSILGFSLTQGASIGMLLPFFKVIFYPDMVGKLTPEKGFFLDRFFQGVTKFLVENKGFPMLLKMGGIVLFLFFVKGLFGYLSRFLNYKIQENVSKGLRDELFKKLIYLPLSFYDGTRTGELVSRFTHDTFYLRYALAEGIFDLLKHSITIIVFFLVALWASWHLTVFSLFLIPLLFFLISRISSSLRRRAGRFQARMGEIGSILTEILGAVRTVKAFVKEKDEVKNFEEKNISFLKHRVRFENLKNLTPHLTEFLGSFIAVLILIYGGKLIFIDKTLSPERFFVFLAAILSFLQPIKSITIALANVQQGSSALQRLNHILKEREETQGGPLIFKRLKKGIVFKDVWFSYDGQNPVLKNINLSIQREEKIALVGPSGAGKSTLVNLIPGFYHPQKGFVYLDENKIIEFNFKELRKKIAIVPQDIILFSGTLLDNIRYGKPSATKEEIWKVVEDAALLDFIRSLPRSLQTKIGERGVTVSGGEKQRIAIARAFLIDPEILILDEATSQVDSESESKIQTALKKLEKGRTTFTIAHRLSTVLEVDRIVVLDAGEVVAIGKHKKLLETSPLYQNLYNLQFNV